MKNIRIDNNLDEQTKEEDLEFINSLTTKMHITGIASFLVLFFPLFESIIVENIVLAYLALLIAGLSFFGLQTHILFQNKKYILSKKTFYITLIGYPFCIILSIILSIFIKVFSDIANLILIFRIICGVINFIIACMLIFMADRLHKKYFGK